MPEIQNLKSEGINPTLAVILAGGDSASNVYFKAKERTARDLGITFTARIFAEDAPEKEIVAAIDGFNRDPSTHGILVEFPLPKGLNANKILSLINPLKDVDGASVISRGTLMRGGSTELLVPVTPLSCLSLLDAAGIDVAGKKVCLVGRGETVGIPLLLLLIKRHATVTICHTKTPDLPQETLEADIIVSAAGVPGLLSPQMLMPGQVVIDCGVAQLGDGSIVGDADPRVSEVVDYLSPVPGGVGALTVTLVMQNLLKAIRLQREES
jgi:methylenetetrahydrofolate dehydrogenase (NADP+)/methenyltetrahydrofolate cyclohydrolase